MSRDSKPFKTIEEQIEILERRGLSFADKDAALRFLQGQNYYAVINGYKDAFIDRQETNLAGEDRYPKSLPFEAIKLIYSFDNALRHLTIGVLLEAETLMKTSVVYAFCSVHQGIDDYLDPSFYCSKSDYRMKDRYTKGLIKLLSTLQGIRDNKMHKAYVNHYVKRYRGLPLWVASKCLTFGNVASFFDYQKQDVKTRSCVALARATGKRSIPQKELAYAFNTLTHFRNICAHGERLYCARVGKQRDKGFAEMLRALKSVIPEDRYKAYINEVHALIFETTKSMPELEGTILDGMGDRAKRH